MADAQGPELRALAVPDWDDYCPVCDAVGGDACSTPSGKPRDDHKARAKSNARHADKAAS